MRTHRQKLKLLTGMAALLLTGLLVLIALLSWQDRQAASRAAATPVEAQRLVLKRPGYSDITLSQTLDGDGWSIIEPCRLAVNPQRLQPLLEALALPVHTYDALEVDLEAAGLNRPSATVEIDGQSLNLGQTDLGGERRFARLGNRVFFVPEWILSLIDGGLSALASLNVFAGTVLELSLDGSPANAETLAHWQALTALQIVHWPLVDAEPIAESHRLLARINTGDDSVEHRLDLHYTERYAALHYENSACAYILPVSSLPISTTP